MNLRLVFEAQPMSASQRANGQDYPHNASGDSGDIRRVTTISQPPHLTPWHESKGLSEGKTTSEATTVLHIPLPFGVDTETHAMVRLLASTRLSLHVTTLTTRKRS
jgi:hypothetical protein